MNNPGNSITETSLATRPLYLNDTSDRTLKMETKNPKKTSLAAGDQGMAYQKKKSKIQITMQSDQ